MENIPSHRAPHGNQFLTYHNDHSYGHQMGFPVVTVSRTDNNTVVVTQEYFLLNDKLQNSSSSSDATPTTDSPSSQNSTSSLSSASSSDSSSTSSSTSSDSASSSTASSSTDSSSSSSPRWWVPVTYISQDVGDFNDTSIKVWMSDVETTITIPDLPPPDRWVIFNVRQSGE